MVVSWQIYAEWQMEIWTSLGKPMANHLNVLFFGMCWFLLKTTRLRNEYEMQQFGGRGASFQLSGIIRPNAAGWKIPLLDVSTGKSSTNGGFLHVMIKNKTRFFSTWTVQSFVVQYVAIQQLIHDVVLRCRSSSKSLQYSSKRCLWRVDGCDSLQ